MSYLAFKGKDRVKQQTALFFNTSTSLHQLYNTVYKISLFIPSIIYNWYFLSTCFYKPSPFPLYHFPITYPSPITFLPPSLPSFPSFPHFRPFLYVPPFPPFTFSAFHHRFLPHPFTFSDILLLQFSYGCHFLNSIANSNPPPPHPLSLNLREYWMIYR